MMVHKENPSDVGAITDITKAAFTNHLHSHNTEHLIVIALRAANALTISLVAEVDGERVGHIAFSPVTFTDGSENWYGLGPISVLPAYQKKGIGTKLVNEGLDMLKDLGAQGCVLVGDPDYYERFGFKSPNELRYEGVPQENLLVLPFGNEMPAGVVEFHQAFFVTE